MTPADLKILVLDAETVWGEEYTLSKLTTEEYVRDPRFHAFGFGYKWFGGEPAQWVTHADLPAFFASIDWAHTAVLAHNAAFDIAILSWIYGCRPAYIFDSLSMARALFGVEQGNSLAKLATRFNLPPKGTAVNSTKNLLTLPPHIEAELAEYCCHDVLLCELIFTQLYMNAYGPCLPFPKKELDLIDLTMKMYTDPVLRLNAPLLEEAKKQDAERLADLLDRTGVKEEDLASNVKFADLLAALGSEVPIKISKTTGNPAPALAKTDVEFQALVNSDNEDVALLCEARLRVKSTLERTRAQRFLDIASRGNLPVPLNYYGASTGRWSAAKQGINLQNLKRGSFLREAIEAPPGRVLVVGDLSQIEPRVLAWYAGFDMLLDTFRSGEDAYGAFGATMFGIPGLNKREHPLLRQSAKSALLGCFAADTLVLTQRGWVPIVRVLATDTVWDGVEWVQHAGVVPQGEKEIVEAWGLSATSDHEILTEHGWVEWHEIAASGTLLRSALLSASLPAWIGCGMPVGTTPLCAAPAALPGGLIGTTSCTAAVRAATHAQSEKLSKPATLKQSLRAQTTLIVSAFLGASAQLLAAVRTLPTAFGQTMADAASLFTPSGWHRALRSCATLSDCLDGTNLAFSLIEKTTTGGMSPATYALSHAPLIPLIDAPIQRGQSKPCVRRTQTYDIALAGSRNRYTILSASGPIIAHNCGYGLGWPNMASQLLGGFLGAPPQRYDMAFFESLGLRPKDLGEFVRGTHKQESNQDVALQIPHTCSEEQMLVHCCVTRVIIDRYRAAAKPVVKLWRTVQGALHEVLGVQDQEWEYKGLTFVGAKGDDPTHTARIMLPNGMAINYEELRLAREGSDEFVYGAGNRIRKIYGSKVVENLVQAVARVVCSDAMRRVDKRYRVVHCAHDELVCVVPEKEAEEALAWVLEQMTREPRYLRGIPLAAEGGFDVSYGKAKK